MIIKQLSWEKAKQLLQENGKFTELLKAMDKCIENNDEQFFHASYEYGEYIIKNACFELPNDTTDVIIKQLDYNHGSNPFGLCIEGAAELFIEENNHVIPYSIHGTGATIGSWLLLDGLQDSFQPVFKWDMTAGARSAYMVPKVSRTREHDRLCKKLNIERLPPKDASEHWEMFKEIAKQNNSNWRYEVIYFPKSIIERLHSSQYQPLKYYLLNKVWSSSSYMRNSTLWNSIYAHVTKLTDIRLDTYDLGVVKHILATITGEALAFKPATDETLMPLELVQDAYYKTYGLKNANYIPSIMVPGYSNFTKEETKPAYYSFQYPTNTEMPPKNSTFASQTQYAKHLKKVLEAFLPNISGVSNSPYSPIEKAISKVKFDFSFEHPFEEIYQLDDRFSQILCKGDSLNVKKYNVPKGSTIMRNFLKISQKP